MNIYFLYKEKINKLVSTAPVPEEVTTVGVYFGGLNKLI